MGLTKQYLRYGEVGLFNIVGSPRAGLVCLELRGRTAQTQMCAVGACEHVIVWDLRKGEKVATFHGDRYAVTMLCQSPDKRHLAVGYADGTIKVFDIGSGDTVITFSGHKSPVSALNYDKEGMRLVSGSADTDVIVWDIVNESGLFRLRGHKGMVTQARFLNDSNILITSSKDTLVKFWDLDTQHCFRTLAGHKTEVWDFVVARDEKWLITGSADMDIRIWSLQYPDQVTVKREEPLAKKAKLDIKSEVDSDQSEGEDDQHEPEELNLLTCTRHGSLLRQGKDRVVSMNLDPTGRILGVHGSDATLELFKILTDTEVKKHLQKRQKKARKRARDTGQDEPTPDDSVAVGDEIRRVVNIRMSSRLRSFGCRIDKEDNLKVVCLLTNNTVETCQVDLGEKKPTPTDLTKLSLPGHRSDVRTLGFSSDSTAILSASAETVKIWNRSTLQCIRTIKCDYALCSLFAPGDRHIVLGTKSGKLQIFDIATGVMLESIDAHTDAVWSICMAPDKRSIVSGSADNEVKFWDFELISDEDFSTTSKRLTLVHSRTLKMTESVLGVKYSPDHRLLAVALLDNTVKVFFADTLKFFLSLYGHKLPVLCMDISSDSTLLVTGSADRNVKLWGLDFGDCHKSIFAHDDSIMTVQFVSKTHMFFTGGKDGLVKEWDGDSFDHIQTLKGHQGEVWSLSVSPSGNFVVSASHDKSLRLWEKTQEPLVLEEEKEMEREKEFEESLGKGEELVIPGETNKESVIAGKKTTETVKAAERLMEALELYQEESAKLCEHQQECQATGKQLAPPPLHPLFQAYKASSPERYVLEVIRRIRSSELEESLLVLPFSYVPDLLKLLHVFVESDWEVELACRCLFFLLRVHQGQITSSTSLLASIDRLRTATVAKVTELRDTVGLNLAALQFLKQQVEEKEEVTFFADATDKLKQKKKKPKKRAILAIKT